MTPNFSPSLLPVLVGVTGHRAILPEGMSIIRKSATSVLEALKMCFGDALLLVTALAEGADQLVAELAAELEISMIAISPMPVERYRGTMDTDEGRVAFDRLWNDRLVCQRIELPLLAVLSPEEQDAAQYEQLALLLSRQSHILLALWNGKDMEPHSRRQGVPRQKRGGSSHVVAMRRFGERQEVAPEAILASTLFSSPKPRLELAHSGPILHLVTPTQSDAGLSCEDLDGQPREPGALLWWSDLPAQGGHHRWDWLRYALWPEESDAMALPIAISKWQPISAAKLKAVIPKAFIRIHEASAQMATLATALSKRESFICPNEDMEGVRNLGPLWRLRRVFDSADEEAGHMQRRLFGSWLPGLPWPSGAKFPFGMLLFFAFAVPASTCCFELFTEYGRHSFWFGLYLAAILVPSVIYIFVVKGLRWQERYQDHRALAEGLRVQFFWAAAGIPFAVSDNYLRDQAGLLGWIRFALSGPALDGLAAALATPDFDYEFIRKRWIEDQLSYFNKQRKLQERAAVMIQRIARAIITFFVSLAVFLFLLRLAGSDGMTELQAISATELPLVILGTLPAVAAFFLVINEARAYEEHAHSYTRAHGVFAEAELQSQGLRPEDSAEWQELLLALGQAALAENAAWIHTHRARPVAIKVG